MIAIRQAVILRIVVFLRRLRFFPVSLPTIPRGSGEETSRRFAQDQIGHVRMEVIDSWILDAHKRPDARFASARMAVAHLRVNR